MSKRKNVQSPREYFPPIITDKCIFDLLISNQENYDKIQEIQDLEASNVLQSLRNISSSAATTANFVHYSNGTSIFLKPLEVQVSIITITIVIIIIFCI